ncbi:MAG: LVIVD repeat-containing protein [bacterium]
MKKQHSYHKISITFFMMILIVASQAWCQISVDHNYFEALSIVDSIAYIDVMTPPDLSTIPPTSPLMELGPIYPEYHLKALTLSNPYNPIVINTIKRDDHDSSSYDRQEIIHGDFIFSITGEEYGHYAVYGPYPELQSSQGQFHDATFSIAKIDNNERIMTVKSIPLTDTLNALRITADTSMNEQNIFVSPILKIFDHYAYILFTNTLIKDGPDDYAVYGYPPPSNQGIALVVLDIATPQNPSIMYAGKVAFDTSTSGRATDFIVSGALVYMLVSSYDSSSLHVLNIASPKSISMMSSLKVYGQDGTMALQGNTLFLSMNNFGLEVVDISKPFAPALIGWFETPAPYSNYSMKPACTMIVKDTYVYLLDSEEGLIILDVSDRTSPYPIGHYNQNASRIHNYSQFFSMAIYNKYLLLLSPTYIDIVSVHDPYSPELITTIGEKEPTRLNITLRIEAMDMLTIKTENNPSAGSIALFNIPSLDQLNRKYGAFDIIRNSEQMYGMPDDEPADEPTMEEIINNRYLREFTLLFPEAADIEAIRADYKKNPYVVTAYSSLFGPYGQATVYPGIAYGSSMSLYGGSIPEPLTNATYTTSSVAAPFPYPDETVTNASIRSDQLVTTPSAPILLPGFTTPYVPEQQPIPMTASQPFPPFPPVPDVSPQPPLSGLNAPLPLFRPASPDPFSHDIFNPLFPGPTPLPGITDPLINFNDPLLGAPLIPNPFDIGLPFGVW